MTQIRTLFIGLLAISFSACEKPLTACIDIESTTVSTDQPVLFKSCSENAISLEWYMEGPDGAPENGRGWSDFEITNTFTVPGTYKITLNTYDDFSFLGEKQTAIETLTVN